MRSLPSLGSSGCAGGITRCYAGNNDRYKSRGGGSGQKPKNLLKGWAHVHIEFNTPYVVNVYICSVYINVVLMSPSHRDSPQAAQRTANQYNYFQFSIQEQQ